MRFGPALTTNPTQSTGVFDVAAQGSAVFYGAMVNLGAFAGPYIPTTTVAVARNADVLTYTGADVANISTAGTAYAEWSYPYPVNVVSSPRILNFTNAGVTPLYLPNVVPGALSLADGTTFRQGPLPTYPVTAIAKGASSWGGSASNIALNGVVAAAGFDGAMSPTQLDIGHITSLNGFHLNGVVRNVRIWNRALSSSELQAITS
jgi:hypothetical protein